MTRVLAVDPGLTRCGIAIVAGAPGRRLQMEHVGVIGTEPDLEVAERLLCIDREVDGLLQAFSPDAVVVERVFSQHNVTSAMSTAQAAAVVLVAAAKAGIPTAQHTPTEVKAAVTGNGRAEKSQVAAMVVRLLALKERPRPADATDALALAICHIWQTPMRQRRQAAGVAG